MGIPLIIMKNPICLTHRLLIGVTSLTLPTLALANHIDYYVDGAFTHSSNLGDVGEVMGDPANILGGFRSYEAANLTLDGTINASLASGGPLQLRDLDGAQGQYWFGYGNESSAGDLNADFVNPGGWNAIGLTFDTVVESGTVILTLNSGPDTFTFSDLSVSAPGTYQFLYSDLLDNIPGFDFQSVDGANLEITSNAPNAAFDVSDFSRITVATPVPEPTTGVISALLLTAGILRRRRH